MTLTPAHLGDVAMLLQRAGLTIAEGAYFFDVDCDKARIWVEARPPYCNRGRYLVNAQSEDPAAIEIDWADGFPRYYFGAEACASELLAWMAARALLPEANLPDDETAAAREALRLKLTAHHQIQVSEPVSFIAGNGPIIVRPAGMADDEWGEIVRREAVKRSPA
jgi:hypothetical protein